MIRAAGGVVAVACVIATAPELSYAQVAVMDSARLVKTVREVTSTFRDVNNAILAGYRPVGPHSPTMGQHWINPASIFPSNPDPARPGILTYLTKASEKILVGVGYAFPAPDGHVTPNTLAQVEHWHVHAGNILDEGFFLEHKPSSHAHSGGIAVLHVWAWSANPDGLFAANNWALPFLAHGITPGAHHSRDVARALSIAGPGAEFALQQIRRAMTLTNAQVLAIDKELRRTSGDVLAILDGAADRSSTGTSEALARAWRSTTVRLERALPKQLYEKLRAQYIDP